MSTRYEVGQKVVIANEETLRHVLSTVPEMYKYAGTTMTIYTTHSGSVTCPYYMVEDGNDNSGRRWHWSDDMIDHEATARLMENAAEPEESNEFSVDYYTNKVYDMFNRFARNGELIDRANKFTKDGIRKNVEEWLNISDFFVNTLTGTKRQKQSSIIRPSTVCHHRQIQNPHLITL